MGIWLGAFKPRVLRLIGRKGDGWTRLFWPVDPSPRQVELLANEVVSLLCDFTPDRGGSS